MEIPHGRTPPPPVKKKEKSNITPYLLLALQKTEVALSSVAKKTLID